MGKGVKNVKVIIRREWKNYLKNPLYWLAFLIFLLGIWQMTSPYLTVHYFQSEEDLMSREVSAPADRDIMEGYIRQPEERMIRESFPEIRRYLVDEDGFGMSDEEADAVLDTMLSEHMTVEEADRYMEETYSFLGAGSFMEDYEYGRAGLEEANAWIRQKMEEHPYSWYLARKFTDALSLYVGFGSAVLVAFLFMRDTRRDTYELLHTKPVGAGSYVAGKVLGGFLPILLLILLLTGCFTVLGAVTAVREGFPYQPLDFAVDAALYLLPNLLMIVSIYAAVALIFRNPLPAVPLVILYMLYSNMGTMTEEGYQYIGKPLAIMIRFDGKFFETSVPEMAYWSQPALLLVSAVLLWISAGIWKNRRVYSRDQRSGQRKSGNRLSGWPARMPAGTAGTGTRRGTQDRKIALPAYKIAYSLCFFVILSVIRGVTDTSEIGITLAVYTGALAAVFFADTCELERREKRWEIFCLFPEKQRVRAVLRRIRYQWLWICAAAYLGYWLFFWQRPLCGTFRQEAGLYLMYLAAVTVNTLFFGVLSMTLTNRFRNLWAGIGGSIAIWMLMNSTVGERLFGNWDPLAFQSRDLLEPGDLGWMLGECAALAVTAVLLALLPKMIRKGVRG